MAGVVSTTLITRHLLFVGFSLSDENFHLINNVVQKLSPSSTVKTSTAFQLSTNPLIMELNENIEIISITEPGSNPPPARMGEAARELEIVLDYLTCCTVSPTHHLLDPSFDPLLSDEERCLRAAVEELRLSIPKGLRLSAYSRKLDKLFQEFGLYRNTFFKGLNKNI